MKSGMTRWLWMESMEHVPLKGEGEALRMIGENGRKSVGETERIGKPVDVRLGQEG